MLKSHLMDWSTSTPSEIEAALASSVQRGLPPGEARRRLAEEGPNELPEAPRPSPVRLFLSQFSSLIVWVLLAAAAVSGFLRDWIDVGVILAIVLLNAVLGFVQEYRAERSLAALKRLSVSMARVTRDGRTEMVPARELVGGDLIQVEAGDLVPADARLVYATALRTQEASLTGESTPVDKTAETLKGEAIPLGDRSNMVFLGTAVAAGKGRALVVATGAQTELGRIATLMQQTPVDPTPLQKRLTQLGQFVLYLSLGVVTLVFVLGRLRGEPLVEMFLTSVSLAVAAIPEGLPAIVTMTLALGVTRMVRRHALIRRLPAVETLGSTTVICTDKTGTLTKNEMTVTRLLQDDRLFEVSGEGYAPSGEIRETGETVALVVRRSSDAPAPDQRRQTNDADPGLRELLTAFVLCNDASLGRQDGDWRMTGDPTEGALLVAAAKAGLSKAALEEEQPVRGEIPFDPERKLMTVLRDSPEGARLHVKGAPDVLLRRCSHYLTAQGEVKPLDESRRQGILDRNGRFAREALRVLAAASRPLDAVPSRLAPQDVERELVFLGLAAMKDPLRPEALTAVRACREAGIQTVMITGDHKDTATAIARELGILDGHQALSGRELDRLSDDQLAGQVRDVTVYARVSAEHKLRIVRAWRRQGAVVAMTGDGVNDAPAVKEADIGVAMGLTGTDVTKEASDMVVTDDNFASIAAAVEEGRGLYDNIRKSVHYLLSCNLSEVLVMLLCAVVGLPLPLLPVHILWINLVTDGLPALALAVDPPDPGLMRRPPRNPAARFLDRGRILLLMGQGLFMAAVVAAVFAVGVQVLNQDLPVARTMTFTVLVLMQLAHAFNCRSDRLSLARVGLRTNRPLLWAVTGSAALQVLLVQLPWTDVLFKLTPLGAAQWLMAVGLGLLPLAAMELWKAVQRARGGAGADSR